MYQPITCVRNMQLFKQFSGKRSSWASPDLNRNPLIPKWCTLKLGDYLVTHLIKRFLRFIYQKVLGPKLGKSNTLAGKPVERKGEIQSSETPQGPFSYLSYSS